METKLLVSDDVALAMQAYATQVNLFLDFIEQKCPRLTKAQSVELATLLIVQMAVILAETETPESWLSGI